MKRIVLAFFVTLLACFSTGLAKPLINTVKGLHDRLAGGLSIGVLPIAECPAALDCAPVENGIYLSARSRVKGKLVIPTVVRQKMFEEGISSIQDDQSRTRLAEALGVEAFLVPSVPHLGSKTLPQGSAPDARVEIRLIDAATGQALFQGSDQMQGGIFHTPDGIVGKLFRVIVEQGFPKSPR